MYVFMANTALAGKVLQIRKVQMTALHECIHLYVLCSVKFVLSVLEIIVEINSLFFQIFYRADEKFCTDAVWRSWSE